MNYIMYKNQAEIVVHTASGGRGEPSEPALAQTRAAAPTSPPTNISVAAVRDRAATLVWGPPTRPNGVISQYQVIIRDKTEGLDRQKIQFSFMKYCCNVRNDRRSNGKLPNCGLCLHSS